MISNFSFGQEITKKKLKSIIKESIKESKENGAPFDSKIKESIKESKENGAPFDSKIITENRDSIFYKSKNVKLYSSYWASYKYKLCRTVEFRFYKNNKVNLIDCQTCEEPSTCYVTKEQNIYDYKIYALENKILIKLFSKFTEMIFEINSIKTIKENSREYYEIEMQKI